MASWAIALLASRPRPESSPSSSSKVDVANANEYVTADDLGFDPVDLSQVVALRVSVTANSVDAVTEDGNPLRRTFTKTIVLRNANPEF